MTSTRRRLPTGRPSQNMMRAPRGADEELRRSYPAQPWAVAVARDEFAALAERHGATNEQLDDIRLLVSEAVTNAMRHAYPGTPGPVYVMATATGAHITFLISDDGIGPRTRSHNPGAGWGWPLMAALCRRFTVRRRSNGGTEVEMQVRVGPEGGPATHGRRGSDSSACLPAPPLFSTTR